MSFNKNTYSHNYLSFYFFLSLIELGVTSTSSSSSINSRQSIFTSRQDRNLDILIDVWINKVHKIKKDANVLIVEDVITTGKSALECSKIVKESKAILVGYACIIDRSNENLSIKNQVVSQMKFNIETFPKDKIPEKLKTIEPIKPGSRNLSK